MSDSTEAKIVALRQQGVLNPRPLGVIDAVFQDSVLSATKGSATLAGWPGELARWEWSGWSGRSGDGFGGSR